MWNAECGMNGRAALCRMPHPECRITGESEMAKLNSFFEKDDRQLVLEAIASAEKKTSAEVRIYVREKSGKDPMQDARAAFNKIGMRKTQLRNGVLFYLSLEDKKFVILGDDAINEKVTPGFWEIVRDAVIAQFKSGQFATGLAGGINIVGEKLAEFFPAQKEDVNELPDAIVFEEGK